MNQTRRKRRRLKKKNTAVALLLVLLPSLAFAAYVLTEKDIELVDNGVSEWISTHSATVGDLLEKRDIILGELDTVFPGLEEALPDDGGRVVVNRAFPVSVTADFATETYLTQPQTVAEFLADNDVTVGEFDWVSPALDSIVTPQTAVVINRITYRTTQTVEPVQPKTIRREDPTMNAGQTKVLTEGVAGEKTITNLITYKDGVPIAKQELSRAVTTAAVDEVMAVGTRKVISRGGQTYAYTDVLAMRATAYTHTGSRTSLGSWPSVGFTVAVDPDVIPLGTMLYVDGYGYAKAEDTGGAIDGNRIDVFLANEQECLDWGVRTVRVYVLE